MIKDIEKIKSDISIITVVYNGISNIEKTILSVINQEYEDIEYIIIDGGSTDGTVDIIKKYQDRITYWVSEPDKGIYDAMNKGIEKATGEWVNFMNAGDCFFNNTVLQDIFIDSQIKDNCAVIYGDTVQCFSYGNFVIKAFPLEMLKKRMAFCHQSSFVRRNILVLHPFDCSYRVCADYNLFYKIFESGYQFYYLSMCISIYEAEEGLSSINRLRVLKEECKINGIKGLAYYKLFLRNRIRTLIVTSLPHYISRKLLIRQLNKTKDISVYRTEEFHATTEKK